MSLVRSNSTLTNTSTTSNVGKGVAAAGGAGLAAWLLAGLLPFVGVFGVSVAAVIVGLALMLKR